MDRCKVHPRSLLLSPRHLLGSFRRDIWGRTVDLHNILPLCVVPDGVSEHLTDVDVRYRAATALLGFGRQRGVRDQALSGGWASG